MRVWLLPLFYLLLEELQPAAEIGSIGVFVPLLLGCVHQLGEGIGLGRGNWSCWCIAPECGIGRYFRESLVKRNSG